MHSDLLKCQSLRINEIQDFNVINTVIVIGIRHVLLKHRNFMQLKFFTCSDSFNSYLSKLGMNYCHLKMRKQVRKKSFVQGYASRT